MTTEAIRKTVPLTQDEAELLEAARIEGTAAHEALIELLGPGVTKSEAATLHAALQLGLDALKDRISERGYAALAAAQTDEDKAFHEAMRKRGRRSGSSA
jgi:Zn-dependent M32 family carboxypeptidase